MARHDLAIGVLARCDSPVQLKGMPLMGQHTVMKESHFIDPSSPLFNLQLLIRKQLLYVCKS